MFKKILILLAALTLSFIGSFLINVNFVIQSEAYSVWPVLLIFALIIGTVFVSLYFLIDKIAPSSLRYTFAMAALLLVFSGLTDIAYVYVQNHTDWLAINNGTTDLTTVQTGVHSPMFFYAKYVIVLLLHLISRLKAKLHKNV